MSGVARRRRPRRRSVNFRRLRFVLTREAAYRVLRAADATGLSALDLRAVLVRTEHGQVVRQAEAILQLAPALRVLD